MAYLAKLGIQDTRGKFGDVNIGGGGLCGDFEPSGQTLGVLIWGERFRVETGRGSGARGFRDRYGGVLGKSLEILILEGVRGLGPEIGNIDTGGVRVWDRYR